MRECGRNVEEPTVSMNRSRLPAFLIFALPVAVTAIWLVRTSRAATETPHYSVVRTDGKFEIRDYPALTVATTPMESRDTDRGFRRLFGFISGKNEDAAKIAMTAPVLIETAPEKRTMSFIMPRDFAKNGVPLPAGEEVVLGNIPAARFAALRFRGGRSEKTERDAVGRLEAWVDAQNLTGVGSPIFAFYDPPWTPVFLRRNEVLIRVDPAND